MRPRAGPDLRPLEPIRQGVRERFGEIGDGVARGLRLRHDHGSNYLADDGVLRHRELAEFRAGTPRRRGLHPHAEGDRSDTIEELRLALLAFKRTYNEQWMLEKYHYRSPAQVR